MAESTSARRRVILAAGTGFLGRGLSADLIEKNYEVIVLSRTPPTASGPITYVKWDGRSLGDWAGYFEGAKAVVNLAGKNVSCRYTPENRREIDESRVNSVRVIHEAISQCADPPAAFVQAASLAIYGDAGDRWCDESAPPGQGFPVETCLLWEEAFRARKPTGTRCALLRIGFALGDDGGALKILTGLVKRFLGGTVGSGRQYISWLHRCDLNQMFLRAIEQDEVEGVYNATGPNPLTNAEFMRTLRKVLHRPWSPPTPAWAVHIGSCLMRTEACLALTGRRCEPNRFVEQGFEFQFPHLHDALQDVLG